MRETQWGIEEAINLLQPLNTNTVNQDTFGFEKGGPAILNNGLNRDGGITELFEDSTYIAGADHTYITSNGLALGIANDGTVLSTIGNGITPDLYPSTDLYPSLTLYPSGGYGAVVEIGKLNSANYFNRMAVPTYYLDCVVSSSSDVSGYAYTLIAARYGSATTIILEELDPDTMGVLSINGTSQRYVATVTALPVVPSVCLARMNVMTFGDMDAATNGTVMSTGGFIYNVGTAVHYWRNAVTRDTAKTTDLNYQAFTCYNNGGTTIFTTSAAGVSGAYYNATPGVFTAGTWSGRARYSASNVDALMLGDFGANVLSDGATTLKLGASTASSVYPAFFVAINAAGAVSTATGFGAGVNFLYYGVDNTGSAFAEADFIMDYGVVTPYGCCGICHKAATTQYGNFHKGTASAWTTYTVAPTGIGKLAYPQLDVEHQMLRVRSYRGVIALLTGNTFGIAGSGAFTDTDDAGNIVNDYAGGSFEYDLASGSPAPNGLSEGAKNFYFYPLSWRGATATTGITVYRLNNGDFVCVSSTTTPKFSEIGVGVVAVNTLSAWGAIIDVNAQALHYNYSGYTPSFKMGRDNSTAADVLYLKIFNKYSSSLDQGQVGALYSQCQPMSGTSMVGWTVWNGTTGVNVGDFSTSTTAPNTVASYAPHNGIYFYNANVPPAADALFKGGGIVMLNASAIQTPNYFGYYIYPEGGGSNLLPWRDADVFLLQGSYYAYNNEYVYQINLTNGSTGVVQGAPIAIAYAIGLVYLCVSPKRAYFLSNYDNSVYFFDGGRSLVKFFEANQKPPIIAGAYNVRDNALSLQTVTSVLTLRDEQDGTEVNAEGLQITENDLPTGWNAYSYMKSTANGLYFVMDNTLVYRSYQSGGTLLPMDYRTAHYSPGEWQTMQVGRIVGQFYCTGNKDATITLTFHYIQIDGTTGSSSATVTTTTRNAQGYFRFSWTPPVGNVLAGSVEVEHTTSEQKIVMMELVMYYIAGPEAIPLTEVSV